MVDDLSEAPWRATNYIEPHEYIMANWSPELARLIERVRVSIAVEGYDRMFRGQMWRSWDHDGYCYWMMPKPTWPYVLNRKRLSDVEEEDDQG